MRSRTLFATLLSVESLRQQLLPLCSILSGPVAVCFPSIIRTALKESQKGEGKERVFGESSAMNKQPTY
jgi:hypothetical protein